MSLLNAESAVGRTAEVTVVEGYVPVIDLSSARSSAAADRRLGAVIVSSP